MPKQRFFNDQHNIIKDVSCFQLKFLVFNEFPKLTRISNQTLLNTVKATCITGFR